MSDHDQDASPPRGPERLSRRTVLTAGAGPAAAQLVSGETAVGGIAETQEVIDYCVARDIKADVELISPEDINKAFDRVVKKDVWYRFVIDMAKLK